MLLDYLGRTELPIVSITGLDDILGLLLSSIRPAMVTERTDIEMKEELEFSDPREEAAYWRQMAEQYAQKSVTISRIWP